MIALRNYFPHGCMAPNGCDDPACPLCAVIANLPQPAYLDAHRRGDDGTRDGVSARKGGGAPRTPLKKSHRVGPHS